MSYILDALRKADAERERDPARGIHAQPLAGVPGPERRPRAFALASGAAVGLVLAAGAVYLSRPAPPPGVASVVAAKAPTVAPPGPAPAPAVQAVVAPAAGAVFPPAPPPAAPAPAAVAKAAPAAVPAPPARAVQVAAASPAAAAPAVAAMPAPGAALLKAPPAAVADRVLALSELPADVRGALPKLAISGGVHSDNAAQRMLIVGGEVLAEGAEVAPGVVLEQIRARAAVLRFRGYRFSVVY